MNMTSSEQDLPKLIISFRGTKYDDFKWTKKSSLSDAKAYISSCAGGEGMSLKLIHKGKVLTGDDYSNLDGILSKLSKKKLNSSSKPIRLMAMTVATTQEINQNDDAFRQARLNAPRVRDDLSYAGQAEIAARQRLGRKMLQKSSQRGLKGQHSTEKYGFHRIETLPMLPEQQKAKEILQTLANDPGILACMGKHEWNVGCLAEMYPEGKVGESPVCVMGLNQNKGQKILLRLRTDDLKGFRKVLSIRKVLFHELAHNVHSEHNGEFYQLMRQIETECNELDWTRDGQRSGGVSSANPMQYDTDQFYTGGAYVLGSNNNGTPTKSAGMSKREIIAKATEMRMAEEEQEIEYACECFQDSSVVSESRTQAADMEEDETM